MFMFGLSFRRRCFLALVSGFALLVIGCGGMPFTLSSPSSAGPPTLASGDQPLVADAGSNQTVDENTFVFLDGNLSIKPNARKLSFRWSQISGPPVHIVDAGLMTANFVAPRIDTDSDLIFLLEVSDRQFTSQDTTLVHVLDVPDLTGVVSADVVANAGPDREAVAGKLVVLNGSASIAPGSLTFAWSQVSGQAVVINNPTSAFASFIAPDPAGASEVLVFQLLVSDRGQVETDEVAVTLIPVIPPTMSCNEDADGDGVLNCNDGCPTDPAKDAPGVCGCGQADADTDGDGVPDCVDQCPGEADVDSDGDGVLDCLDTCPNDPNKTDPGACGCGLADVDANGNGVVDCLESDGCVTSTSNWENFTIAPQTGVFTVEFDATPNDASMASITGLSSGSATTFGEYAVGVAFSANGKIEAWNPEVNWYDSIQDVPYAPGTIYHFRIETDLVKNLFSVFVTPDGASELTVAQDYTLRTPVSTIDHWAFHADIGSHDVCNFAVLKCTTGPDSDGDGVPDCADQCPGFNDAIDSDADGVPDGCDICPGFNDLQDSNGNGIPDGCEPPILALNPTSLNFGSTTTTLTFQVWNSSGGTINYSMNDNATWLSVSPTSGDSSGEHDTISVNVDRTGLLDGMYQGEISVTPNVGSVIMVFVTMNVGAGGAPMTTASRTSGVAPLGVFFDAVDTAQPAWTSGVVQADPDPITGHREYAELHYRWDFGDPASGTWSTNGKSKNQATGYVTAHVFENPGTYTVALQVIDAGGQTHDYEQQITVTDPAVAFANSSDNSAERTFYVSTNGNDANNGSLNHPFKSWAKGMNVLLASNGPRRLLLERGATYPTSTSITGTNLTGPFVIGAYGTGGNPIISSTHSGYVFMWRNKFGPGVSDVRIVDVDFTSPNGATKQAFWPGGNSLILRSRISHHPNGIMVSNFGEDRVFIVDCDFVDSNQLGYGIFYSWGRHIAILGCEFDDVNTSEVAHLLRTYITHSLISHNILRGGGSQRHQLKFVGYLPEQNLGVVEYCVISDNLFEQPGPAGWSITIGPTNSQLDQRVANCVFERNIMRAGPETGTLLNISARYVTVRNNIFDATGSTKGVRGIDVFRRGIEPVPLGNHVYNNTGYRSDTVGQHALFLCAISPDAVNTTVKNNLASVPTNPDAEVVHDLGNGTIMGNNEIMDNPGWVQPGTDFHLTPGAAPVNAGTTVPSVRFDFDGIPRPVGVAPDLGAYELP